MHVSIIHSPNRLSSVKVRVIFLLFLFIFIHSFTILLTVLCRERTENVEKETTQAVHSLFMCLFKPTQLNELKHTVFANH